ncbi:terminase small subunit [Ruminococcus sp.]|uniref:terminase small subunit n=1 Tax=Ruminococcus sp. TaxID=41978 RepID=UPI00386706A4
MKNKSKKLTAREKAFCNCFVSCGSADEAAFNAGFVRNPKKSGEELLCRDDIANEIKRLGKCRTNSLSEIAAVGYRRLAFGKISDAVSLLYMDNPSSEQLEHMDLFMVSEIKRPKDGSMEIKFFDRLKALEKLTTDSEKEDRAMPFYDAIANGARALRSDCNES